jgi:hypothetical protein
MGAKNFVGKGLSYRPARLLRRLAESISGLHKSLKIPAQFSEPEPFPLRLLTFKTVTMRQLLFGKGSLVENIFYEKVLLQAYVQLKISVIFILINP